MGDIAYVTVLPDCDIHKYRLPGVPWYPKAAYDGATKLGPWAFMCEECFADHGVGLGTGVGQRLVVRRLTRVVQDPLQGYRWQKQYYDRDKDLWFDLGDARDTEAEAAAVPDIGEEPVEPTTHERFDLLLAGIDLGKLTWFCPGCGSAVEEGGTDAIVAHVRDCDKVDDNGQPIKAETFVCFTCGFAATGTREARDTAHLARDGAHHAVWYRESDETFEGESGAAT